MDFTLSEAQDELAGLARKILAERDTPWPDLAAAGVLAAGLPEALGGAGLGLLEQCSVLVEIGRATSDVPYLASIVLGAGAIAGVRNARTQATPVGRPGRPGLGRAHRRAAGGGRRRPPAPFERGRSAQRGRLAAIRSEDRGARRLPRAGLVLVLATATAGRAGGVGPDGGEGDGVACVPREPSDHGVDRGAAAADGHVTARRRGRVVLDGVTLDDDRVLGAPGRGAEITRLAGRPGAPWGCARCRRASSSGRWN